MKITIPEYKPSGNAAELDRSTFLTFSSQWLLNIAESQFRRDCKTNQLDIQTTYREFYEKAIELDCEETFLETVRKDETEFNCKFWALPKPLQHVSVDQDFPVDCLPSALKDYLKAVAKYNQVPHDMCILPLLSVLAMCAQGKAKVEDPQNGYTSELTLYTLTVAPSSARKSSANDFLRAATDYQKNYNKLHEKERLNRQSERDYYKSKRDTEKRKKDSDLQKLKDLDEQIEALPELPKMLLNVSDATTEALIKTMSEHGGKMAVIDTEGGILSTLAGMYNGGATNISFICNAYDGQPYYSSRVTSGEKDLERPLLTLGLLTQDKKFYDFIGNEEFQEKGLTNRFLFAFPKFKQGSRKWSDYRIPQQEQEAYTEIINNLLSMPESDTVIKHNRDSYRIFRDFFEDIQRKEQSGGIFEHIPSYAEKQYTIGLKIAALLHLCEHEPTEPIDGTTALHAVSIMMWAFNQAVKAFSGEVGENPIIETAKKIIGYLQKNSKYDYYSLTDLRDNLHFSRLKNPQKELEMEEALEILLNSYYIDVNKDSFIERGAKIKLNPFIPLL